MVRKFQESNMTLKMKKDSGCGERKHQASMHDCGLRTKSVGMKSWLEEWDPFATYQR